MAELDQIDSERMQRNVFRIFLGAGIIVVFAALLLIVSGRGINAPSLELVMPLGLIFLVFVLIARKGQQHKQNRLQELLNLGFAYDNPQAENLLTNLTWLTLMQHGKNKALIQSGPTHFIDYVLKGRYHERDWTIFHLGYYIRARWDHTVFLTLIKNPESQVPSDNLEKVPEKIPGLPFKLEYKDGILIAHAPQAVAYMYNVAEILDKINNVAENLEQVL